MASLLTRQIDSSCKLYSSGESLLPQYILFTTEKSSVTVEKAVL